MAKSTPNRYWTLITILLIAVIVGGSIVAGIRYRPGQPVEISLPSPRERSGEIYIGGAIVNPGLYPLEAEDSLEALIQAAGGTTDRADPVLLKLYIPEVGEAEPSQKIDLNRAETWLLEALPGIGETLARRIVDYRRQNGPFANINQLTRVKGIGAATYEQLKHLITVADE